jgi:DNA polymerase-3 subunit delta'
MQFKNIVGQSDIKNRLIQTVKDGRISHAQLFAGGEGSGNLAMAIAYGQYINCLEPSENDSCGVCSSCAKYEKLVHPDLTFAFPVATSPKAPTKPVSNHYITDWREAVLANPYLEFDEWISKIDVANKQAKIYVNESTEILKSVVYKRFEAKYKVVIIWHAEKMNTEASNRLLKFIEEPQDNTLIIMVTDDSEKIIRTILSRTQHLNFNHIELDSLAAFLEEKFQLNAEKAMQVAAFSDGDYNSALRLIEMEGKETFFFETFKNWMRMCFAGKLPPLIDWVEEISAKTIGREQQKNFLTYALRIMRESIISNYADDELLRLSAGEKAFLNKFAPYIHTYNILEMNDLFNDAYYHIERNANPKLVFFNLSTRVTKLLRTKNVNL